MKYLGQFSNDNDIATKKELDTKQATLISGTNIKTINSISLLGSGDLDVKELYLCTYGTTTYAQITSALSAGKLPVCFYDSKEYVYVGLSSTNRYTFCSQLFDTQRYVSVNSSDSWGTGTNNFEVTSNKVTSLSSASTNSQYPSAKAVYDFVIDGKEIFYCTYGTTTYTEISSAVNNGKTPIVKYGAPVGVYILTTLSDGQAIFVSMSYASNKMQYKKITVSSSNSWNNTSYNIENISNKVTSLSSDSTDTQYPSAKLVYDQLLLKQDVLTSGTNIKTINNNSLLGSGDIAIDLPTVTWWED